MQTQTVREVVRETHILPSEQPNMKNKGVSTKPFMLTKGVSCRSILSILSTTVTTGTTVATGTFLTILATVT